MWSLLHHALICSPVVWIQGAKKRKHGVIQILFHLLDVNKHFLTLSDSKEMSVNSQSFVCANHIAPYWHFLFLKRKSYRRLGMGGKDSLRIAWGLADELCGQKHRIGDETERFAVQNSSMYWTDSKEKTEKNLNSYTNMNAFFN